MHQNSLTFSFQDSLASYPFSHGGLSKYQVVGDTLIVHKITDILDYTDIPHDGTYQYKILKLNQEQLRLLPLTPLTEELFKFSERMKFTGVESQRITQKNDLTFERIGFYSSMCYGTCPYLYLEVDAQGNIWYEGRAYTEKDGLFSGTISQSELSLISGKVRNINLQNLEKKYSVGWSDDQTFGVKILTNEGDFMSHAYGIGEEPAALRLLFDKLINIYKFAELTPDSTAKDQFLISEFEYDRN
ncbi:MAG: hypothetical protein Roseis2KO_09090 [Roseivirga sp.]